MKTTGRSGRLADRLRAKRFHQIFAYLDQVCPQHQLCITVTSMHAVTVTRQVHGWVAKRFHRIFAYLDRVRPQAAISLSPALHVVTVRRPVHGWVAKVTWQALFGNLAI